MKIVINKCWGGFSLSKEACLFLNINPEYSYRDMDRTDLKLIECVETLREKADGNCADLVIFEIPDSSKYEIDDNEGMEILKVTL